jgi:hypothetical protein
MMLRCLNEHFGSFVTGLLRRLMFLRANLLWMELRTVTDSILLCLSCSTSRFLNCSMPYVRELKYV